MIKIATVSLNQAWEDKDANIALCEEYIDQASQEKADVVVFPEMTLTGFSINIDKIAEDEKNSQTIAKFQSLARMYRIAVVFGVVIKDNAKALNKSIFVDSDGQILKKYAKIHPFSFSGEDRYFNSGNKLGIVTFKEYKIALSICYDLRFPELYTALSKNSDLVINIANWPKTRVDHWNTLLKARAIENQIFIAGVNRTGIDGNELEYEESSNIYNANGEIMKFESFKDMKIYKIDKNFTKEFRNSFNTVNDRKINFYKEVI